MEAGNGVIMALPHIGSWEWGGAWLALQGYPMTSVAEPLKPPAMYDWFVSQREAMGLTIVPLGADASRVLLRTLRAGKLVGLLCDRDIVGQRHRGRVLRRAHHHAGRARHAGAAHRARCCCPPPSTAARASATPR